VERKARRRGDPAENAELARGADRRASIVRGLRHAAWQRCANLHGVDPTTRALRRYLAVRGTCLKYRMQVPSSVHRTQPLIGR
jgi:hypothetical protein